MNYLFKFIKTHNFYLFGCVLSVLVSGIIATFWANAASAQTKSGITITPPLSSIVIPENQTSYRHTIMVANNSERPINLTLSATDFGDLKESGGLLFLGETPNTDWDTYRLTPWLTVTPRNLQLEAGEQGEVVAIIQNDANLSPGGHYAAIMAKIESGGQSANVAVNSVVSSLMFVNKQGGEVYGLSLNDVSADIAWWGSLKEVSVNFANTGNTHVAPRGSIVLKDPLNKPVAQGVINAESTLLLPQSKQTFTSQLTRISQPIWPGTYTVEVAYRYDGQDEPTVVTKQAFSIGILGIVGISLLVILLVLIAIQKARKSGDGEIELPNLN